MPLFHRTSLTLGMVVTSQDVFNSASAPPYSRMTESTPVDTSAGASFNETASPSFAKPKAVNPYY